MWETAKEWFGRIVGCALAIGFAVVLPSSCVYLWVRDANAPKSVGLNWPMLSISGPNNSTVLLDDNGNGYEMVRENSRLSFRKVVERKGYIEAETRDWGVSARIEPHDGEARFQFFKEPGGCTIYVLTHSAVAVVVGEKGKPEIVNLVYDSSLREDSDQ